MTTIDTLIEDAFKETVAKDHGDWVFWEYRNGRPAHLKVIASTRQNLYLDCASDECLPGLTMRSGRAAISSIGNIDEIDKSVKFSYKNEYIEHGWSSANLLRVDWRGTPVGVIARFSSKNNLDEDGYLIDSTMSATKLIVTQIYEVRQTQRQLEELSKHLVYNQALRQIEIVLHGIKNDALAIQSQSFEMKNEIRILSEAGSTNHRNISALAQKISSAAQANLSIASRAGVQLRKHSVDKVMQKIYEQYRLHASKNEVPKFDYIGPRVGLFAKVDEIYLSYAVGCLLENAFHSVSARHKRERSVSLQLNIDRENVDRCKIIVFDTGLGCNDLSRIRMPGYSTKRRGNGLGLSAADEIVAQHNGELLLDSEPGSWFRATINLPTVPGG